MKYKKEELSPDNIYPHDLSPAEKAEADRELVAYRVELWNNRSRQEVLRNQLMQLKYQIKDSVSLPLLSCLNSLGQRNHILAQEEIHSILIQAH